MSTLSALPDVKVPMFDKRTGAMTREWYIWFQSIDEWARGMDDNPYVASIQEGILALTDGVAAPAAAVGFAQIFVDVADGDTKVIYGNAFTKLIAADS